MEFSSNSQGLFIDGPLISVSASCAIARFNVRSGRKLHLYVWRFDVTDAEKWRELFRRWDQASIRARLSEAFIDQRMTRYLNGVGPKPTVAELELLQDHFAEEAQARGELDNMISEQLDNYRFERKYGRRPEDRV